MFYLWRQLIDDAVSVPVVTVIKNQGKNDKSDVEDI